MDPVTVLRALHGTLSQVFSIEELGKTRTTILKETKYSIFWPLMDKSKVN